MTLFLGLTFAALLRVSDVLRHHMHTRNIRVAGCVKLLSPIVPDSCTYIYMYYVNMRGAIPLVHAAHFVSLARDIIGTFVIILGKY